MVYMAYHCVGNHAYQDNQTSALDYILKQQDDKGVFGNEYSTALALQVSIILSCFPISHVMYQVCLTRGRMSLSEEEKLTLISLCS